MEERKLEETKKKDNMSFIDGVDFAKGSGLVPVVVQDQKDEGCLDGRIRKQGGRRSFV